MQVAPDYDQVPRKLRFEAEHPDITIVHIGPAWQAVIPRENGEDVITRFELRALLDVLDQKVE